MAIAPPSTDITRDSALYILDRMRPMIEQGEFRSIVRMTEHLAALVHLGGRIEEAQKQRYEWERDQRLTIQ